jgi:predicted transcriptional regulator
MVTPIKQHIRRTVPLRIKLSPEMATRLDAIARPRGLTPATMGAFMVGEYVERFERSQPREIGGSIANHDQGTAEGFEGSSAGAQAAAEAR